MNFMENLEDMNIPKQIAYFLFYSFSLAFIFMFILEPMLNSLKSAYVEYKKTELSFNDSEKQKANIKKEVSLFYSANNAVLSSFQLDVENTESVKQYLQQNINIIGIQKTSTSTDNEMNITQYKADVALNNPMEFTAFIRYMASSAYVNRLDFPINISKEKNGSIIGHFNISFFTATAIPVPKEMQ